MQTESRGGYHPVAGGITLKEVVSREPGEGYDFWGEIKAGDKLSIRSNPFGKLIGKLSLLSSPVNLS